MRPSCITDDGLRHLVACHARIERCHFCGAPGPRVHPSVLFDYMGDRIGTDWDRAIDKLAVVLGTDGVRPVVNAPEE